MRQGINFDCTTNNLCFNGGMCVNTNETQYCECQKGFSGDFTYGHFPNCALPDYFLLGFFLFSSLGTTLSLGAGIRTIRTLNGRTLRLMISFNVNIFLDWLAFLCVVVQNGRFRSAFVLNLLQLSLVTFYVYDTIIVFSSPIFAVTKTNMGSFTRQTMALFLVMEALLIVFVLGMLITMDDIVMFNTFFIGFMFFSSAVTVTMGMYVLTSAKKLQKLLLLMRDSNKESKANPKFIEVALVKLDRLTKGMGLGMTVATAGTAAMPVVILVLGSFPFQFVFISLIQVNMWVTGLILNLSPNRVQEDEVKPSSSHMSRSGQVAIQT